MAYAITKRIFWPIISLFIKRLDGLQNIPDQQCILVANHQSYLDGVIVLFLMAWHKNKKIHTFATNEKFTSLFWNMLFNHFGAIRVNGSLDKALQKIKEGNSMAIFPEGQRCYLEKVDEWKHTGLGVLALQTGLPIVPVGIDTYHFWNRHHLLPNFRRTIRITIGRPMTFTGQMDSRAMRKVVRQVREEVMLLARISHVPPA